jgi:hypothetical protein
MVHRAVSELLGSAETETEVLHMDGDGYAAGIGRIPVCTQAAAIVRRFRELSLTVLVMFFAVCSRLLGF